MYYYAGGQALAMRVITDTTPGTLYYLLTDHTCPPERSEWGVGSTSVTLDAIGNVTARQTYYPYGSVRTTTGALPTQRTFTGAQTAVHAYGVNNTQARCITSIHRTSTFDESTSKCRVTLDFAYGGVL